MKNLSLFLLSALCLIAAPAVAEVSYVREIVIPFAAKIVPTVKAPFNPSDPNVSEQLLIVDQEKYYSVDVLTGNPSQPTQFPEALKLDANSKVLQLGTSSPSLYFTGSRGAFYNFDLATQSVVVDPPVRINVGLVHSIATSGNGYFSIIADDKGSSIDPVTGAMNEIFTMNGGTASGEFSLDAHFQAYGTNDLLYVLDYANHRMQMLDPANGFAYAAEFALADGVTTANMQFAIGANGNVYLGDGQGGGTVYDENGIFLGAFSLPGEVEGEDYLGAHYLTYDKYGHVFVNDDTGFHQYLDSTVVPEPSTWMLLLLGGAGVLVRKKAKVSR
jgi:streptogramin lyase